MLVGALAGVLAGCAPHARTPVRAQALAGVGTGVSSALIISSFFIGTEPTEGAVNRPLLFAGLGTSIITPSLGHIYAEQYLTIGMGVRLAAAGFAVYGATRTEDRKCVVDNTQNCPVISGTGVVFLGLAAIAYIGGVAYDISDSGSAATRYQKKHAWAIAPTSNGVAIGGRF